MQIVFMSHQNPELDTHDSDCWLVWCPSDLDAKCTCVRDEDDSE